MRYEAVRIAFAYLAGCALIALGGKWAWSFVRPVTELRVDGETQAALYSLVVISAMICGLAAGGIFSLLARPRQLRHASIFAGSVALLSFGKDAVLHFVRPENPAILSLEGLWVLPFVVSALAGAAITQARALETHDA